MNIDTEARIVSEIISRMVGILVDDNVVAIPIPTVGKPVIVGRDSEVITIKAKTVPVAATQLPNMSPPEAACEPSMFPGLVGAVIIVVASAIMSDPLIVPMYVRRVGMAFKIAEGMILPAVVPAHIALLLLGSVAPLLLRGLLLWHRSRAMGGNVSVTHVVAPLFVAIPTLANSRNGHDEHQS